MADVQIIGFPQSTYTRVVRMAAEEKGIPYELIPEPPHSDMVSAINPLGRIPVMRHGDVELYESRAICGYFENAFGGPALIPRGPTQAIEMEKWVSMTNTGFDQLLIRKYLFAYIFPSGPEGAPEGAPDREAIDGMLKDVRKHLSIIEAAVEGKTTIVGDSVTLADLNLLPILSYMQSTPEAGAFVRASQALNAYFEHHAARPSFQATIPPPPPKDED